MHSCHCLVVVGMHSCTHVELRLADGLYALMHVIHLIDWLCWIALHVISYGGWRACQWLAVLGGMHSRHI